MSTPDDTARIAGTVRFLDDGTSIGYFTRGMESCPRADAELVKVVYPDGRVTWGKPVKGDDDARNGTR